MLIYGYSYSVYIKMEVKMIGKDIYWIIHLFSVSQCMFQKLIPEVLSSILLNKLSISDSSFSPNVLLNRNCSVCFQSPMYTCCFSLNSSAH